MTSLNHDDICKLSAIAIKEKFLQGDLTAQAIAASFLNRIENYDGKIGAFLSVFKDRALAKAKKLDERKKNGDKFGKLAAIPIAIKDNILVKDELNTCASKFLTNYKAPYDATVTSLIESEDGIIIGKTNLDEFGFGSSTENSALKKTYNPWNLKCTPGGSSGGSAAAVAARMCPIALGSDTGGSIRLPAAFCGILGLKPTYGRVSRFGLVAFGSSLDQIGPLTTNTADAALALEVIARHCHKDSTSVCKPQENYVSALSSNIKGMRVGVPYHFLKHLTGDAKENFNLSIEHLKSLGAHIVDIDLDILKHSIPVYYILATAEASTNLARFDGIRYGVRSQQAKTLDDVYDLSREDGFGKEVKRRIALGTYVLSAGYKDAFYKKAQKVRTLIIQRYQEVFKTCDLVASPVAPSAAFEIGQIKDSLQMYLEDIYTISINLAGLPAVSVPSGFASNGMPLGLQLIGKQWDDAKVLNVAFAFETLTGHCNKAPLL